MPVDKIQEIFSKNLKILLDEKDATQLELANFLGVSNTTINNYVKGYNMPRMDKVDAIAKFFNISREELISDKKDDKKEYNPNYFTTAQEAVKFLLEQNVIKALNGVDINNLSDEEQIQMANEVLDLINMVSYKYKK